MDVTAIIVAASIPSALTGFFSGSLSRAYRNVPTRKRQSERNGRRKWMPERRSEKRMNSASSTASTLPWHSEKPQPEPCNESRTHTAMGICTQHLTMHRK